MSNVMYTRLAVAIRGSTSYFSQFSETFLWITCTYHANRVPKSPPDPVIPNPPFAPAALTSEAPRLFKRLDGCAKTAEFMTITFDCTEEMRRMCPAAVHVDGTARPQLVSEHTNPSFYRILRGYYERTGIPAMINTSFNMHEEPIVCSPADAVRAFLMGNIDYLAIGPFLVPHPKLENLKAERQQRR